MRAKVVAVAKTTHEFIVYCHASLIALNQATDIRYQFKQGQKLLPQFRYIACLVSNAEDLMWWLITIFS